MRSNPHSTARSPRADHHTKPVAAHAGQQQLRQLRKCLVGLDLQDDAHVLGLQLPESLLELVNVGGMTNE